MLYVAKPLACSVSLMILILQVIYDVDSYSCKVLCGLHQIITLQIGYLNCSHLTITTRGHSESADLRQGSSSVSTYFCYGIQCTKEIKIAI